MEQTTMLVPVPKSGLKGGEIVKGRRPMSAEARANISEAMRESAERRRIFLEKKKAYNKMYLERKRQERFEAKEAKLNEKLARLQGGDPQPRLLNPPLNAAPAVVEQSQHPMELHFRALMELAEDEIKRHEETIAFCKAALGEE